MYNELFHNLKTFYRKYPDMNIAALTLKEFYRLNEKKERRDENGNCTISDDDYRHNRA